MNTGTDLRYDTAAIRTYAANLAAFWAELRTGGMDRREALEVVIALIRALNTPTDAA